MIIQEINIPPSFGEKRHKHKMIGSFPIITETQAKNLVKYFAPSIENLSEYTMKGKNKVGIEIQVTVACRDKKNINI